MLVLSCIYDISKNMLQFCANSAARPYFLCDVMTGNHISISLSLVVGFTALLVAQIIKVARIHLRPKEYRCMFSRQTKKRGKNGWILFGDTVRIFNLLDTLRYFRFTLKPNVLVECSVWATSKVNRDQVPQHSVANQKDGWKKVLYQQYMPQTNLRKKRQYLNAVIDR